MSESLRQQTFDFLDINPFAQNEDLYKRFPNESKDSLRVYKKQWLEKLEELGVTIRDLTTNETYHDISRNILMNQLTLKNGKNKGLTNCQTNSQTVPTALYPKIAKKNQLKESSKYHLIPLIKTFKLLPLYIFKKTYDVMKFIEIKDYSVVEIIAGIIDLINLGNYNIEDLADFTLYNERELKGFLNHESWKRSCINDINSWIGFELKYNIDWNTKQYKPYFKYEKEKKVDPLEFYKQLKGLIINLFLPQFYGIYLYTRKKEFIVRDFAKACFINNQSNKKPISLSQLIKRYNEDLDYRTRSKKYYINLNYSEDPEFLNNN